MSQWSSSFEFHYGGKLVSNGKATKYIEECLAYSDFDPDKLGILEMQEIAENFGYKRGQYNIYHLLPDADLDGGLRLLTGDVDVMDMCAIHANKKIVKIYFENVEQKKNLNDVGDLYDVVLDDGETLAGNMHDNSSIETEDAYYFNEKEDVDEDLINRPCQQQKAIFLGESSKGLEKVSNENDAKSECSIESDKINSPPNSDDERTGSKFIEFDANRDKRNPKLKLGMIFRDDSTFRAALREYLIREGLHSSLLRMKE